MAKQIYKNYSFNIQGNLHIFESWISEISVTVLNTTCLHRLWTTVRVWSTNSLNRPTVSVNQISNLLSIEKSVDVVHLVFLVLRVKWTHIGKIYLNSVTSLHSFSFWAARSLRDSEIFCWEVTMIGHCSKKCNVVFNIYSLISIQNWKEIPEYPVQASHFDQTLSNKMKIQWHYIMFYNHNFFNHITI